MGRVLKRVPLDFEYPQGQIWKGYYNPFKSMECKCCDGSGLNAATKRLSDEWYTHLRHDGLEGWQYHLVQEDVQALIEAGRLWDFTRVPINDEQREIVKKKIEEGGNSWLPFDNGYVPTAEEVNAWARKGFGHDGCNQWVCVKARAQRLGIFGHCPACEGEGRIWYSDEVKKMSEDWKPYEPPTGEGYQLWETTSEGSPDSPVFETLEALCEWCAIYATTFGSSKATAAEWKKMLSDDFVHHKEGNMIFI